MNPDIPPPDDAPNEVGVVVGDAEVVDGRDCFGRADRSNLNQPTAACMRNQLDGRRKVSDTRTQPLLSPRIGVRKLIFPLDLGM